MCWTGSDHRIIGSSDHRIFGSSDHRIIGSSDHRIIGSSESADHRIIGSAVRRIIGSSDHRTIGSSDHRIIGWSRTIGSAVGPHRIIGPSKQSSLHSVLVAKLTGASNRLQKPFFGCFKLMNARLQKLIEVLNGPKGMPFWPCIMLVNEIFFSIITYYYICVCICEYVCVCV